MDAEVLYYPSDKSFPLVDMYYKKKSGELIGIQATSSKSHPKPISVYQNFCMKLGIEPEITKLILYYLILPRHVKHFDKARFPESKFRLGVGGGVDLKW